LESVGEGGDEHINGGVGESLHLHDERIKKKN
jgi:hypothetical protein